VLGSNAHTTTSSAASMPSSGKLKPNSIRPCRLLLAWRPTRARNVDVHRALFGIYASRPALFKAQPKPIHFSFFISTIGRGNRQENT
jgi:hypothetical protein